MGTGRCPGSRNIDLGDWSLLGTSVGSLTFRLNGLNHLITKDHLPRWIEMHSIPGEVLRMINHTPEQVIDRQLALAGERVRESIPLADPVCFRIQ